MRTVWLWPCPGSCCKAINNCLLFLPPAALASLHVLCSSSTRRAYKQSYTHSVHTSRHHTYHIQTTHNHQPSPQPRCAPPSSSPRPLWPLPTPRAPQPTPLYVFSTRNCIERLANIHPFRLSTSLAAAPPSSPPSRTPTASPPTSP